jgi:phosphatidylserine decarboxylase
MRFAREGLPFLLAGVAALAMLWSVLELGPWQGRWARISLSSLALLALAFTLFTAYFFRDPDRVVPGDPGLVVAPADGRVLSVEDVDEPTFMGGPARRVTIFLNVFDVHVQRSPVAGVVRHYEYRPGKYLVAWEPKASELNEQASLGIETPEGPVLVRQIAGLVARRIVTRPREGDILERGARYGLIRFGSRVDLFVPVSWEIGVEPGHRVRAGSSVIGRMSDSGAPGSPGKGDS